MAEHTKEPWHIGAMESGRVAIDGQNGEEVTGWLEPADAGRIVACVNACAGIPTWLLEADVNGQIQHMRETMKQRDELLAALEDLLHALPGEYSEPSLHISKARAAIASLKGGAA